MIKIHGYNSSSSNLDPQKNLQLNIQNSSYGYFIFLCAAFSFFYNFCRVSILLISYSNRFRHSKTFRLVISREKYEFFFASYQFMAFINFYFIYNFIILIFYFFDPNRTTYTGFCVHSFAPKVHMKRNVHSENNGARGCFFRRI